MKKNSTKFLKWLTGVVVFVSLIAVTRMTVQTFNFFFGSYEAWKVVWIDGVEILQVCIALLRLLGGMAFFGLLIAFMVNSIKGLKNGTLFPRKNIGILFSAAAVAFIFLLCQSNIHMVLGERVVKVDVMEILVPAMICSFAIMYKVAANVSEENSLTI